MSFKPQINDADVQAVTSAMGTMPGSASVAEFVPGPGIQRLEMQFDIEKLQAALEECLKREAFMGGLQDQGFAALPLTRRPGQTEWTANDLSGRYWLRADGRYVEEPREELVPEVDFSEFNPKFKGTYLEHVHTELAKRFPIGRTRVLSKGLYNCNSWHRDPEPRLHIPVITNPGALFIVNHHVTHLPADGSVYFTDTRGYHTALNGGETRRVHVVAALAYDQVTA
ncbi:peptide-aspartate beta-dioxygenase [Leisingera methylohalidivorans]|uniref:Peptide-aspartate beta-dioxygenase n=1 Tax=Leisingera methylohalidivorans DSM 14336 TaxID=999552 RepID=V9VPW5_9RHOB|nr:peptide-aspartate beta-dioxygenase [Leisingera methylohalidivorans]AHC99743.1 peptide-aspartate beta-dioxygenase [Leisingera methylohalidivorans DSM 14336]